MKRLQKIADMMVHEDAEELVCFFVAMFWIYLVAHSCRRRIVEQRRRRRMEEERRRTEEQRAKDDIQADLLSSELKKLRLF